MNTEPTDEQIRDEFYNLVHHQFGGDLVNVEIALSKHPNRKVSRRTIQSWLVKGNRPSRRTCPEWAPDLLRSYLEEHTDRVERGRAREKKDRLNSHLKGYGTSFADRVDEDANAIVDRRISQGEELVSKFASVSFAELPYVYAAEINGVKREQEGFSHLLNCILDAINKSDEDTSVHDLKKSLYAELHNLSAGRMSLNECERDVIQRRNEFSSVDGTLTKKS